MLIDHWPLLGLRLSTARLEMRLPTGEELAGLADLAAQGVHDPDRMPFTFPWTDLPPAERARSVVQHHWLRLGNWSPGDWALNLSVFAEGRIVGVQTVAARDFAVLREVTTASWLGLRHHGQGIGTEMRTAALELAFTGLGADEATSGAYTDNPASYRVSDKLGYRPDGVERHVVRGRAATMRRLRMTREQWQAHRTTDVTVSGLDACLPLFLGGS